MLTALLLSAQLSYAHHWPKEIDFGRCLFEHDGADCTPFGSPFDQTMGRNGQHWSPYYGYSDGWWSYDAPDGRLTIAFTGFYGGELTYSGINDGSGCFEGDVSYTAGGELVGRWSGCLR
jgi:hypothetical protein